MGLVGNKGGKDTINLTGDAERLKTVQELTLNTRSSHCGNPLLLSLPLCVVRGSTAHESPHLSVVI